MLDLIDEIERLCRRHNSPAVNPATHALAQKIIAMIEAKIGPAQTLPRENRGPPPNPPGQHNAGRYFA